MKIPANGLSVLLLLCAANAVSDAQIRSFKLGSAAQAGSALPPSNSVSHIVVVGDSAVIIGTGNGLAKSTTGGRGWISYGTDPAFSNNGIFSVAASGDTIWTSTGYDTQTPDGSVQTGSGYALTTNGGATWQHRAQTLDAQGDSIISYGINDSLWILPVVVPQQNVTFDISLSPGTVWIASWASGLRRSTDLGQHWERIVLPPDDMNSLRPTDTLWSFASSDPLHLQRIFQRFDPRSNDNFLAFSVCAQSPETVWCGTAGGVNLSTDGGTSWVKFSHQNQAQPILGNWVISIKTQPLPGTQRVWTTNWRANDPAEDYGVSYTDNAGRTWTNLIRGVKAYEFAFKDSITYIATDNGVMRTADGGATIVTAANFADPATHQIVTNASVYAVGVLGDTVFVCTGDGIASTIDNATHQFGSSWSVYRTYQEVGTSGATYAYPNPFSPALEFVRIHYGSAAFAGGTPPERSVRIEIFDFGMNRVRTLLNGAQRSAAREYDEIWDGRDDGGRQVANGVYFYRIVIDNADPLFGKILVLQ